MKRCELSYRRCESNVKEMMRMIDIEVRIHRMFLIWSLKIWYQVSELDTINGQLADGKFAVNDIERR